MHESVVLVHWWNTRASDTVDRWCCDTVWVTSLSDMLSAGPSGVNCKMSRLDAVLYLCWCWCWHCVCAVWTYHMLLQLCTATWCVSIVQDGRQWATQDIPAVSVSACCKSAVTRRWHRVTDNTYCNCSLWFVTILCQCQHILLQKFSTSHISKLQYEIYIYSNKYLMWKFAVLTC